MTPSPTPSEGEAMIALADKFKHAYWPKVTHGVDVQLSHEEIKLAENTLRRAAQTSGVREAEPFLDRAIVRKHLAASILNDMSTKAIFDLLLSRINFDGMDPNSFTIAELRRAIPSPDTPREGEK